MELKKKYSKSFITLLLTGFIFFSNFVVLVDFAVADEKSCCATECQCKVDNECEMTIACGTAHVVILIPLFNSNEEKFLADIAVNDFYKDLLQFPELHRITKFYKSYPILKTPSTYINTPLLI
ncbi:MAG: hypothetical protein ACLFQM_06845 [Fidelibacterota bacterium]